MTDVWPALPLDDWKPTLRTVHLWSQVVGKVALGLAPHEPQWGHGALQVTPRGIGTRPLPFAPAGQVTATELLDLEMDFVVDELRATSSSGSSVTRPLRDGLTVAAFFADVVDVAGELGASVTLNPRAQEMPDPPLLDRYTEASSYDGAAVRRFHAVAVNVANALADWRAAFRGRSSPVNFWWGTFDLATTRFSGRPAAPPPGSDLIFREAMDAEEIAVGFWPGDARYPKAALYGYAYPKPDGFEQAGVDVAGAYWNDELGEYVLDWDDVRRQADPHATIVAFAQAVYDVGADLAGWDKAALAYP